MPNDLKTFIFEGKPLTFRQNGEEWWATAEEAATLLGHKRARAVLTLADRHAKRFRSGEQGMLDLNTPGGKQRVRVFSPRGLARLCLLGRTEVSHRLHDWVIYDVMETLRSGARLAAFETALETACAKTAAAVAARYDAVIAQQGSSIAALARLGEVQASNAGRMLSLLARDPDVRRVLDAERDRRNGVNRLPFPDGDVAPSTN